VTYEKKGGRFEESFANPFIPSDFHDAKVHPEQSERFYPLNQLDSSRSLCVIEAAAPGGKNYC
jgi:hypothetical protein